MHDRYDRSDQQNHSTSFVPTGPRDREHGSWNLDGHAPTTAKETIADTEDASPSKKYMNASLQASITASLHGNTPKLVVLDLNGTLVFRKRSNKGRQIHPRPYVSPFVSYIMHQESPFRAMIWSSARPENVDKMVKEVFGERSSALEAVWARDTLGLTEEQYATKVQTLKDLSKIWNRLPYSPFDTILIDDSPLKARLQPYNHLVLKDYDQALHRSPIPDETLLAVVGILSEIAQQSNVCNWIRNGGLHRPYNSESSAAGGSGTDDSSKSIHVANGELDPTAILLGTQQSARQPDDPAEEPDAASVEPLWFQNLDTVRGWIDRGKAELRRLNIRF
ncbi:hypothetical protein FRB99_005492 [Tulasnella sp. 403]|nr:hypothetical protein FRB99_005492 [Tulasnella sp. 403]